MKKIVLLLLLLIVNCLSGQEDYIIKKIYFTGNKTISGSTLKKELVLKAENFSHKIFFSFTWIKNPHLPQVHMNQMRARKSLEVLAVVCVKSSILCINIPDLKNIHSMS